MEHTNEPWVFDQQAEIPHVMTADGFAIVEACPWGSIRTQEEMSANARRIEACVNACAGTDNETLHQIARMEGQLNFFARIEGLKQQRDELQHQLAGMTDSAKHFSNGMEYYRGLIDEAAKSIGIAMYTADDQGVHPDPLRAKLPECVAKLVQQRDELLAAEKVEPVAYVDALTCSINFCGKEGTLLPSGTLLYTTPQPAPAGMVLVPVEPTPEMILAGLHHENIGDMEGRYKAMLAAFNKFEGGK